MNCIRITKFKGYQIKLDHLDDRMWVELNGRKVNEACIDLAHAKRVVLADINREPLPVC